MWLKSKATRTMTPLVTVMWLVEWKVPWDTSTLPAL
jgi:hypothetical protein